jgi:GNAT superfamily N-acetyltransferase
MSSSSPLTLPTEERLFTRPMPSQPLPGSPPRYQLSFGTTSDDKRLEVLAMMDAEEDMFLDGSWFLGQPVHELWREGELCGLLWVQGHLFRSGDKRKLFVAIEMVYLQEEYRAAGVGRAMAHTVAGQIADQVAASGTERSLSALDIEARATWETDEGEGFCRCLADQLATLVVARGGDVSLTLTGEDRPPDL